MRKLKLKIEDLEVASFAPGETTEPRGTVVGHKPPAPTALRCEETYLGYWTCDYTCDGCSLGCNTMYTNDCGGCDP